MPGHWYWKKRKKTNPFLGANPAFTSSFTAVTSVTMAGSPGMYVEKKEVKDLGLAIEPIVGVREYHVYMDGEEPTLSSFNGCPWPHRQALIARCGDNVFADHEVPKDGCGCGIYAWKSEVAESYCNTPLSGEVYLWGDVLVCEAGYRAEIAYPKNLNIRSKQTRATIRLRDALEKAYGVPVTLSDPEVQTETLVDLTSTLLSPGQYKGITVFPTLPPPSPSV